MTPNNNLSCLPFYRSLDEQNARKWWVYGRIYPLFAPAKFLLPFQVTIKMPNVASGNYPISFNQQLYKADGTFVGIVTELAHTESVSIGNNYYVIAYNGKHLITSLNIPNGQYYLKLSFYSGIMYSETVDMYSEVFTVVNDIEPYLKIEWWDVEDLVFDAGRIVYKKGNNPYHQILYLDSDIAKPEYVFDEEGETRDGYFFPIKQISEKHYRFKFFASEYLLDVMRFIRMADYAQITYKGQVYKLDTFLITPEWEDNGDVATVEAEFDTDTVVKKIGRAYQVPDGGDFNDDFNDDYNIGEIDD